MKRHRESGFSLVEVAIAVAVFAGATVAIIALLPIIARQAGHSSERARAFQLADGVAIELRRLAAARGFDGLAATVPVMKSPFHGGMMLLGSRTGERVHAAASEGGPGPALEDAFYAVELFRFSTAPLAFDAARGVLPVYVRVSWPYKTGIPGAVVPLESREECGFVVTLNR